MKYDLEERLIDFAVLIIKVSEHIKNTNAGKHLSGQIVRSGTSPTLNYGEAQAAESRKDFIQKVKIVLKELRETFVNLKIIKKCDFCTNKSLLEEALKENNELISIFVKTADTAKKNLNK